MSGPPRRDGPGDAADGPAATPASADEGAVPSPSAPSTAGREGAPAVDQGRSGTSTAAPTPAAGDDRLPPVLLVHGTNDTSATLAPLGEALAADGRDVIAVDYGRHRRSVRGRRGASGVGPLPDSTAEVLAAVTAAAERHGGPVDIVGHSQGGLHAVGCALARPDLVAHVVALGTPLRGVRPLGRASRLAHAPGVRQALDGLLGPAVRAQIAGAADLPGLPDLRRRAERPRVLLIASRDDATVPAADLAALEALPGVTVTWVQDVAPGARVSHVDLASDPTVVDLVRAELARPA